jgi:hypothetical protein
MDRRSHWENVYHTKQATEVSWFEVEPATSLALIQGVAPTGGRIIDVGGGASLLVDRLVGAKIWDVTVLDVSATALELTQVRLQEKAHLVRWIQADITKVQQLGVYDIWHDRAVFHFLTTPEDRAAYLDRLHAERSARLHVRRHDGHHAGHFRKSTGLSAGLQSEARPRLSHRADRSHYVPVMQGDHQSGVLPVRG